MDEIKRELPLVIFTLVIILIGNIIKVIGIIKIIDLIGEML